MVKTKYYKEQCIVFLYFSYNAVPLHKIVDVIYLQKSVKYKLHNPKQENTPQFCKLSKESNSKYPC